VKTLPGNPYEGRALKTIILDSKYGGGLTAAAAFPDHVKGGARGAAPEFGRYLEWPTPRCASDHSAARMLCAMELINWFRSSTTIGYCSSGLRD
jgi:hypothetical protein